MKQRDLIKKLEQAGFQYVRTNKHMIFRRGDDEEKVPHHREVNEKLARSIIKKWGL